MEKSGEQLMQWLDANRGNGFRMPDGSIVPLVVMQQYLRWSKSPEQQLLRNRDERQTEMLEWIERLKQGELIT